MNKRSAMTIAAGLVLTLMVAAFAFASGTLGPEPASAAKAPRAARPSPIVHTIKRTVTVHQKADTAPVVQQDPIVVPVAAAVTQTASQPAAGDEGSYEDEESESEESESEESESHDTTSEVQQESEPSDD
jgi:hypothetical protein